MATAVGGSNVSSSAVSSGSPGTIFDAVEVPRSSREDREEGSRNYTVKEEDRPTVAHDEWVDEVPVIDLSRLETDKAGVLKQLRHAVTEWGFFQIVNHGLSVEVMRTLEAQGEKFFGLPMESKAKAKTYTGDNVKVLPSSLHWAESLWVGMDVLDKTIREVWPDGNAELRDAVANFLSGAAVINKELMELIAESLGLESDFFSQHLNSRKTLAVRWNHYLACPEPSQNLGANSHTDGCCLTLLQQDRVGGLQIQKDGNWIGIKPIEGALVVNIGDILHAWTNGTCKSVLHRAVVNKSVSRLSLAAFFNVDRKLSVSAPDNFIDASHPRQYRDFIFDDYLAYIMKMRNTENGQSFYGNGYNVLEGFKLKK